MLSSLSLRMGEKSELVLTFVLVSKIKSNLKVKFDVVHRNNPSSKDSKNPLQTGLFESPFDNDSAGHINGQPYVLLAN